MLKAAAVTAGLVGGGEVILKAADLIFGGNDESKPQAKASPNVSVAQASGQAAPATDNSAQIADNSKADTQAPAPVNTGSEVRSSLKKEFQLKVLDAKLKTRDGGTTTFYDQIGKNRVTVIAFTTIDSDWLHLDGIKTDYEPVTSILAEGPKFLNAVPKESIPQGMGFLAIAHGSVSVEGFNTYLANEARFGNKFTMPYLFEDTPEGKRILDTTESGGYYPKGQRSVPYILAVDNTGRVLEVRGDASKISVEEMIALLAKNMQ